MNDHRIRTLVSDVRAGRLTRRSFISKLVQAGLSGAIAAQVLLSEGIAQTQGGFKYAPTKRGGGGPLKLLWWQAPTLLNPHFATGNKDQDACRIFYEPLASWDEDGNLIAVLAAEIPSKDNGGVAADGKSVSSRLLFQRRAIAISCPIHCDDGLTARHRRQCAALLAWMNNRAVARNFVSAAPQHSAFNYTKVYRCLRPIDYERILAYQCAAATRVAGQRPPGQHEPGDRASCQST